MFVMNWGCQKHNENQNFEYKHACFKELMKYQ